MSQITYENTVNLTFISQRESENFIMRYVYSNILVTYLILHFICLDHYYVAYFELLSHIIPYTFFLFDI